MFEIIPNWHPLFVHFTVALLSLSVLFFIIQLPFAETELGDNFLVFARYSLWIGVLMTVLTLVAGWDAYNTVDHDTPSHTAMTDHKNWAFGTFAVFLVAAIWWYSINRTSEKAPALFVLLLVIGLGLLVATGHKGSKLVFFYGLGVENLPAKDDHQSGGGHSHSHGDDHGEPGHHDNDDSMDDGHGHGSGGHDDIGGSASEHSHDGMENADHHRDDLMSAPKEHSDSDGHSHDNMDSGTSHDDLSMEGQTMEAETSTASSPSSPSSSEPIAMQPAKVKIESYQDGTIRETLPEVALDIQE